MVLIKDLIDYHDKGDLERDLIWVIYNGPIRINRVDHENILWNDGVWNINFQYTLKIVFTDGTEMVFTGGLEAIAKKNENGVDLVTFLKDYMENGYEIPTDQDYMENGYEIPTDQDYIELDDLVL